MSERIETNPYLSEAPIGKRDGQRLGAQVEVLFSLYCSADERMLQDSIRDIVEVRLPDKQPGPETDLLLSALEMEKKIRRIEEEEVYFQLTPEEIRRIENILESTSLRRVFSKRLSRRSA